MRNTQEVVPGLVLDNELCAAAAEGLAVHAPDLTPLTWRIFTAPTRWWLIPGPDDDSDGNPLVYKAELFITQTVDLTVKVNIWYRPDLRGGATATPKPHTHPWEVMEAYPVAGGYEDEHWHRTATGLVTHQGTKTNTPGTVNRIFHRDYHEVTALTGDPGRVMSVMVCGRWLHDDDTQRGLWGHLDLHTGQHVPVQHDQAEQDQFRARLYRVNPQHVGH